jgi:hypothetical protein
MPPEPPVEPKPPWTLVIVMALALAIPLALIAWLAGSWLSNLWFGYGWLSDKGNGPEAIQQTILYAAIAVILVPAVRRFLRLEFAKVHTKIEQGHAEITERLHRSEKLAHHIIVNSPGIDNHVPGIAAEHQPQVPEQE